ncbi:MAG TPA: UDP-N-acetylmuramate--L-alanine ligase [Actinomycetota bacterium]|nr:UDP-N-acetylmuramate--L-alanine ligase [Actinomycetota bacterium]
MSGARAAVGGGPAPRAERAYAPPAGSIPTLGVPDLSGVRRAHLIGVGGAGMRGIARLLLARGVAVTGSDLKASPALDELRAAGADVRVGHRADQVGDPDVVVISTAIPARNPELVRARERGLPILARAQVLAALAEGRRLLAVAGTHGKTTTTSMLAWIVERAGMDPTYVIGGDLNEIGSGARHGEGDVFVAEADESDGSFLLLRPSVAVVTNVEEDHLDFYRGGRAEIEAAFARFCERSARVIACADDPGARAAVARAGTDAVTYGTGPGSVARVEVGEEDPATGRLLLPDGRVDLRLPVPGRHNLLNAAAAVLAAGLVGVRAEEAAGRLASFPGVRRRFEFRGEARGARFHDDYAHHPTEITATIAAARARRPARVVAVFQPHRYTRTEALWEPLGRALAGADLILVTDVYAAGEEPIPGVSGELVAHAAAAAGGAVRYLPHRAELVEQLAREIRAGDLVLTLGAGDVTLVAEEVLERLGEPR